jgi:hypothetical protein
MLRAICILPVRPESGNHSNTTTARPIGIVAAAIVARLALGGVA